MDTSRLAVGMYREDTRELLELYRYWEPPRWPVGDEFHVVAPAMHEAQGFGAWSDRVLLLSLLVDVLWVPDLVAFAAVNASLQSRPLTAEPALMDLMSSGRSIAAHEPLTNMLSREGRDGRPFHADPWISMAVRTMEELAPLVDLGVVRIYPVHKLYLDHVAVQLFGERRYFEPQEMWSSELFVAECLQMARVLCSSYAALSDREYRVLAALRAESPRPTPTAEKLLMALSHYRLPLLEDLTPELVASVRSDEQAFADFRRVLRNYSGQISANPSDLRFVAEAEEAARDMLVPQLDELSKAINRRLGGHAKGELLTFSAAAFGGFALTGDPATAFGTAAATSLAGMLLKILFDRSSGRPAQRVVLALSRGRSSG